MKRPFVFRGASRTRIRPALAGTRQYIYAPKHFLKKYHTKFQKPAKLAKRVKAAGVRSGRTHTKDSHTRTKIRNIRRCSRGVTPSGPSQRFVFVRNPYYHRVDSDGKQLPYIDRIIMNVASGKLIPAKTGAGEADLQARHLKFSDYTFLKGSEKRTDNEIRLWQTTKGSHIALFPNLMLMMQPGVVCSGT